MWKVLRNKKAANKSPEDVYNICMWMQSFTLCLRTYILGEAVGMKFGESTSVPEELRG